MFGQRPKEPHWYLFLVGARPDHRGKGYASRMIEHFTKEADAAGVGCYLENSNPKNTPLYERKGFKITRTVELGAEKIPVGLMWRDPVKK